MRFSLVSVLALAAVGLAQDQTAAPTGTSVSQPADTGSMTFLPIPPTGTAPGGTGTQIPGNSTMTSRQTDTESRTVSGPTGTGTGAPGTSSSEAMAPTSGPQAVGFGLGLGALVAALL
ncbi:hypothetical protein D8B26_005863 [Coccidioides posadasii str. Silveira]|uniref:Uncharacterized protein n=3 Tax=Coccidioides posadasii TaxID=199306 RepID=E9DB59_COCPS|nr:hypothetical protein CPC735_033430 [Coccidioides posadasii C735 delta SOWgp]EER28007.1 hypothetical protein CPC735_033430 [Coccidioides posadasii C735 delta SOWgp]EFW16545.1 conserved hypothetical protein [Coccidioides posadasii str. Silveira]KMM68009.1 hypothetical protein CPAG_04341 [Coccidioides posadasii RMSCC 3488]QVM11211.1 hypothetical protein D8B26_005863 [Coccidioides posadasii str. Silveira]|eukprot:XP_003070152.1 hypothetical protein CPC735_033430 [Coccidioides posadasii C735 delta SOWgp]